MSQGAHKMSERFTDAQMLKLVKIYREQECLWNVKSDLYKNRYARDRAYKIIQERLNIPGITVQDIPKKIKNVRSSYYQELKRIEKSVRSGAGDDFVYKPRVSWFTTMDGILKATRKNQNTFITTDENSNSSSDNESETQNANFVEDQNYEDNFNAANENIEADNLSSIVAAPVQWYQNETSPPEFTVPLLKSIKKETTDNNHDDIHAAIAKIANSVTKSANSSIEKHDDEFDTFGKYIAMTLRSLPMELAIVGKTDIQKVISDLQLKALRRDT